MGIMFAIIFIGCNKPKITCEIVKPTPNATFDIGEFIDLAVTVDVANTTIDEVQIYLDNAGYAKKNFFPFNFKIDTKDMKKGLHTIRAVAFAKNGDKDEKNVSFNLIKQESPDFVSFNDGAFPKTWTHTGWNICSPGFDDNYAIRKHTYSYNDALFTIKECDATQINCIEFYAKAEASDWYYYATLDFSIDGSIENITLNESWTKYSFNVPPGEHTFRWMIMSSGGEGYCYLDAIKFFKK